MAHSGGRNRADVDDPTNALGFHDLKGFLRTHEWSAEVRVDDVIPIFECTLIKRPTVKSSSIVDEQIEFFEVVLELSKHRSDAVMATNVAGMRDNFQVVLGSVVCFISHCF